MNFREFYGEKLYEGLKPSKQPLTVEDYANLRELLKEDPIAKLIFTTFKGRLIKPDITA